MKNLLKKFEHPNQTTQPVVTKEVPQDWEFKKIDISQTTMPKKRFAKFNFNKRLLLIPLILVALLVVITVATVIPAQAAWKKAQELQTITTQLVDELKNQNLEGAKAKLPEVRKKLDETKQAVNAVLPLRVLPVLSHYHQDMLHGLNAAGYGLDAVEIAVSAIEPYADLLGLKGGESFTAGSADERIQLAVQTLEKVTPKITEIGDKIALLEKEVDAIDPERYPESLQGKPVRAKIIEGKNLLAETTGLFLNAQPLLEVLPQLLGQPDPKRYLVLFQNDKELRATGGFMTAYAIFRIEQGKFIVEKSDDIYELDDQIKPKINAPPEILTYHKGVYYFNIRDSNLSPDFSVSMQQFKELYPNKWDFDGIISVDTHVLVESIKILCTFVVKGRTFSSEIDERCDCPKVIYELEDYSTRPVAYVREDRKDVLGELLLQIMKKALGVSPSQYWGQLFQMAISEINQKHILAFMEDEKSQKGVESLNMAGRIADGVEMLGYKDGNNWDYLHVSDVNFAGAKSNLFVTHEVKQEYEVANDGALTKTITIDYKNPAPPSDCNLESGGLCLNGILRNWVRIYVPKGSELISSKGSQSPKDESGVDMQTSEGLGKTIFEGFLTVRPLGSAQLTVKYKLPFKKSGDKLPLLIQKQAGTDGHDYTVLVNGKQREKLPLKTDVLLQIKL